MELAVPASNPFGGCSTYCLRRFIANAKREIRGVHGINGALIQLFFTTSVSGVFQGWMKPDPRF